MFYNKFIFLYLIFTLQMITFCYGMQAPQKYYALWEGFKGFFSAVGPAVKNNSAALSSDEGWEDIKNEMSASSGTFAHHEQKFRLTEPSSHSLGNSSNMSDDDNFTDLSPSPSSRTASPPIFPATLGLAAKNLLEQQAKDCSLSSNSHNEELERDVSLHATIGLTERSLSNEGDAQLKKGSLVASRTQSHIEGNQMGRPTTRPMAYSPQVEAAWDEAVLSSVALFDWKATHEKQTLSSSNSNALVTGGSLKPVVQVNDLPSDREFKAQILRLAANFTNQDQKAQKKGESGCSDSYDMLNLKEHGLSEQNGNKFKNLQKAPIKKAAKRKNRGKKLK